jgi:hypothetical protein
MNTASFDLLDHVTRAINSNELARAKRRKVEAGIERAIEDQSIPGSETDYYVEVTPYSVTIQCGLLKRASADDIRRRTRRHTAAVAMSQALRPYVGDAFVVGTHR